MRVLFFIDRVGRYSETFVNDLCSLSSVTFEAVALLALESDKAGWEPCVSFFKLNKRGLFGRMLGFFIRPFRYFRPDARSIVECFKPDLVNAQFAHNGLLFWEISRWTGFNVPLVIHCHGSDINSVVGRSRSLQSKLKRVSRCPNVILVCPSNFLKRKLVSFGLEPRAIKVISNFSNLPIASLRPIRFSEGKGLRAISVGRLIEAKGHSYLIDAIGMLSSAERRNFHLTVVGDGALAAQLMQQVRELDLSSAVTFLGKVSHDRIADLLSEANIYFQPSVICDDGTEENLSVAVLEAQQVGLPIVASDIGGLPELMMDYPFGWLVPERDSKAISLIIKRILADPQKFKNRLNEWYAGDAHRNSKVVIECWKDLYEAIISNR